MAEIIESPLNENEYKFCEYWISSVLKTPDRVTSGQLDTASKLLGIRRSGGCAQCLRNDALDLNNRFRRLHPKYKEEKAWKDSLELVDKQKEQELRDKETLRIIKEETQISKKKRIYKKKKKDD